MSYQLLIAVLALVRPPGPLTVKGNTLIDSLGHVVRLKGVNVPSLEWSNEGDTEMQESISVAIGQWKANALRIPLSQDRWLGTAERQTDGGAAYRQVVDRVVNAIEARGSYAILDLHWSNGGEPGKNLAQHWMPDDGSTKFWKDCAKRYSNRGAVLFDLYNEPHDVGWEIWQNGGMVDELWNGKQLHYHSPGMAGLLAAVRSTGAKNVVFASGLDWGYDLSGVLKGFELKGPNVAYASHIYPWKVEWDDRVGKVAKRFPVLIGEVGCEPDPKQEDPTTWAPKILAWIDQNNVSWTAWCFHPSASPRLLADWKYTPTTYWGAAVKRRLTSK